MLKLIIDFHKLAIVTEPLNYEQKGELLDAIIHLLNGYEPTIADYSTKNAFNLIKKDLQENIQKQENISFKRAEAGRKAMQKRWGKSGSENITSVINADNNCYKNITSVIKNEAFNFQLDQKTKFANLSNEYQEALKDFIKMSVKNNPSFLTYDEFKSICLNDEFDNFQRAYLRKNKEKLESQTKAKFDVLWNEYPNKSDYKEALEAFKKLEHKLPSIDEMVQSIREYDATNQENANLPTLKIWLEKGGSFDTSENQPQEIQDEQTKTAKDIIKSLSDEFSNEFLNELPF